MNAWAKWTASSGSPTSGTGDLFGWTAPGLDEGECTRTVTITATPTDGSGGNNCSSGTSNDPDGTPKTIQIKVLKTDPDSGFPIATVGNFTPDPVCVGAEQTSSLSATPEQNCICEVEDPTWSWSITSVKKDGANEAAPWPYLEIVHLDPTSSSATLKATFPSCGKWEVGLRAGFRWKPPCCGEPGSYYLKTSVETFTGETAVVGVDRIIVQGSNPEDTGPAGVCVGESITLEAKPCPDAASFPAGEPVWTLTSKPAASTLSNSLGTGTTKAITPDVVGTYVVKAECGSSSDTITINTYIVDLDIFNGQGGSLIADADEESKGAFTVANGLVEQLW